MSARTTKKASPAKSGQKKKVKVDNSNFQRYIYKVLKAVHPDLGISGGAGQVANDMVNFLIDKISEHAHIIKGKKVTLDAKTLNSAYRSALPGELAKHAVSEATKAATKYGSGEAAKGVSRAERAGLQFPVARTGHKLTEHQFQRQAALAPVSLAAVLEYLTAEVLELAGNASKDDKRVRVKPRHILLAVSNDEELKTLFHGFEFQGGVLPHIHSALLPKKKQAQSEEH